MRRSLILVGSLLLIPAILQAQSRGGGNGVAMSVHPVMLAPHTLPPTAAPRMHVSGSSRVVSRSAPSRMRVGTAPVRIVRRPRGVSPSINTSQQFSEDTFDAPGLGFDEVHFAATHPRGRHLDNRNDFGAFFPFFDGGFFLPSAPLVVEETAGEGQPEEVVDHEVPEPQHARTHLREQLEAPVSSRDTVSQPQAKTDEYVFVRRDGTLFFAVAYAWDSGTLRYVTSEGFRRSVARESLDLDATQQFNEQRGLNFRVPA